MKKKILAMLLIVITIFLSGCSTISFYTVVDSDRITQCISVTLDHSEIDTYSLQISDVNAQVRQCMNDTFEYFENQFLAYSDGLLPAQKYFMMSQQIDINIQDVAMNDSNYSRICMTVTFLDGSISALEAYKYFYCDDGIPSESDITVSEGLFYDITTEKVYTVYSGISTWEFMNTLLNNINTALGTAFTGAEATYQYAFLEDNLRIKSNADEYYSEDGVKYHIWNMTLAQTDNKVEFYLTTIHPIAWYVLALSVTAVLLAITFVIYYIVRKKKKRITTEQIEQ